MTTDTILVFSDERHTFRNIRWVLECKGYQVKATAGSEAATEALVKQDYELVMAKFSKGWEDGMHRKELVAMFMESPFYFDMILQERLKLIQAHMDRFSTKSHGISNYFYKMTKQLTQNDANVVTKIIVGYFPP